MADRYAYAAPSRQQVESTVIAAAADVLGVDTLCLDDDIMLSGGTSIAVVRLVSRIRRELQTDLPVETVLSNPRLAAVCAAVEELVRTPDNGSPRPSTTNVGGTAGDAALTGAQAGRRERHRLWAERGFALPPLTVTVCFKLTGKVDHDLLEHALQLVLRRHDGLRVHFAVAGRQTIGVDELTSPVLRVLDQPADDVADAARMATADARVPFDDADGRRIRASIVPTGPDEHVLWIVADHMVVDGWAARLVVRDLSDAYNGLRSDPGFDLPPAPSFVAWARRQGALAADGAFEPPVREWTDLLADFEATAGELLDPGLADIGPGVVGDRPLTVSRQVPAVVAERVGAVCRDRRVSAYGFFHAALGLMLRSTTDVDRAIVVTPFLNRLDPDSDECVGWFANKVPLPIDLRRVTTGNDALISSHYATMKATGRQNVPFEHWADRIVADPVTLFLSPRFISLYLVDSSLTTADLLRLHGTVATAIDVETPDAARSGLAFTVTENAGDWRVNLIYDGRQYRGATASEILEVYCGAIGELARDPAARLERRTV